MTRIPLDIVVTDTGQRTSGKLVAVMVDDLDRMEARLHAAEAVIDNIRAPQAAVDNDHYWDALQAYRILQAS